MGLIDIEKLYEWEKTDGAALLGRCGLKPSMNVLDFGCGLGNYAYAAANAAGKDGLVFTIDNNNWITEQLQKRIIKDKLQKRANNEKADITVFNTDENGLSIFENQIDFAMYFDIFHGMHEKNEDALKKIRNTLRKDGILAVALFSEIEFVQDPVNGPFTPKGKPKWFHVSYEEGKDRHRVIPRIESCGFTMVGTENGAVHLDDYWNYKQDVSFDSMERNEVLLFRKNENLIP